MFFYTLAIIASTFLAHLYQRLSNYALDNRQISISRGFFLLASFSILFLISGLRVDVGSDYESYIFWFHRISEGATSYFEPGFVLLNHLVAEFTNDAQWLFVTSSFITLLLIFTAIKKHSVNPALSVFLYSALSFLFYSFNATRQFIAVGIIFLAYGHMINRKWFMYMFYVLVAYTFHKTALFMAFIYLIVNLRFTKFQYLIITSITLTSILFRDTLLALMTNLYPVYKDNEDFLHVISFSEIFISTGLIALFVMIYYIKKGVMSLDNLKDRITFNSVFFILLIHTGLAWIPAINRISLYLDISLILIVPILLNKIKDIHWRYLFTIAVMIFYSVYTFISIGLNNSNDVLPYNSIFSYVHSSGKGTLL